MIGGDVPCFSTEASPNRDAAQPEHRRAAMVFWASSKAKIRTEYTAPSTVLDMDDEPVTLDSFALEKFLQAQRDDKSCPEGSKSVRDHQSCFDYDR